MQSYDFGLGWPVAGDKDDLFVNTLEAECRLYGLSFILVDDSVLEKLAPEVAAGQTTVKFYLDMASEPFDTEDEFTRLAYALKDAGSKVVDDPDEVRHSADKAVAHYDLQRYHIPVPETLIIRNWDSTRTLTAAEKQRLGFPFIIKPAHGYARQGVRVVGKHHTLAEIEQARAFSHDADFLLQKLIVPADLQGDPAWFRIYHLFGEIIPCWWHPETHAYRQTTLAEIDRHRLLPAMGMAAQIGRITNIDWFSTEIALDAGGQFYVVDYVNDQCSMAPQSREKNGVPDALVVQIARRMVERANQHARGRAFPTYSTLWFPPVRTADEPS